MAGLVPAIHVLLVHTSKTWMPATSAGMTNRDIDMQLRSFWIPLGIVLSLAVPPAMAETFTPAQENPEDYPDGPGREQAFYACVACHGFKLVAQQGQTRQQWDDTLNWMTKRHNMPPIDGDLRNTVLDYLATTFPPRTAPGGWKNPFSGQ
jgi:hypothetical protein